MSEVDKLKCEVEKLRVTVSALIGLLTGGGSLDVPMAKHLIGLMPEKDIRTI